MKHSPNFALTLVVRWVLGSPAGQAPDVLLYRCFEGTQIQGGVAFGAM